MSRIKRDHLRVDVERIAPLTPDVSPRPWFDQLCASYFFADLHDCLLRLGVQSGVGEETLQARAKVKGGLPLGETTTDLVNTCVDMWRDQVLKGRNPGILHVEIAVPSQYGVPVLERLKKFASYSNGELPVELGMDPTAFKRALKGTSLLRGDPYFKSVRLLAYLTSKSRSEIIENKVLIALSHRPPEQMTFLGSGMSEKPLPQQRDLKIYGLDDVLRRSKDPEQVRTCWESYPSETYGGRVTAVMTIWNTLISRTKIQESDLEASLRSYHGLNGNGANSKSH